MTHDIDHSTGKPAMAYIGEVPWHGLGEALPPGQPIEVWLSAARLEWELQRLPVQYWVDGKVRTMPGRYVLARSDTHEALSVVAADYNPVQPREVLEFYRDLVADFGYRLETAGALAGGRKVWALASRGDTADVGGKPGDDTVKLYLLLATSCDKTLATTCAFTSVRVVCQNTLGFALDDVRGERRKHIKVPHSRRFVPDEVKQQLGLIDVSWAAFLKQIRAAAARPLDDAQLAAFFDRVLGRDGAKPLPPKAERDRLALMSLYRSAPGQATATAQGTLWGAVNAVTYYVDHVGAGGAAERLDSAWFGSGAALKGRAWDEAEKLLAENNKTPA